jgi:MFS family permease
MRRLLLLVGAIVLVDLMFYAAIVPLLPWYADRFDLSKTGAGVLAGSYAAGTLLGALPSGWLATRLGSRRTVLIGLVLMSVSSVGFAFGQSIAMLDTMRFVQGVGGACTWAGGLGWLISLAPPEERGATIGKALSAALFGLLLGPALGALAREIGPEIPFTAVGVLGVVLIVAALRAPAPAIPAVVERPLARALRDGPIRFGMLVVAVPALVFGVVEVLAPLELDRLGATSIAIAGTFLVASAIEAGAQVLAGRATDRHGRIWPLRIGFLGAVLFMLAMPLPQVAWALAVVTTIGCVITGALNTPAMTTLSDGVEAAGLDQGFGFAIVNLVWAGGQVVGTIAGGALAASAGDAVVYLVLAGACALTLATVSRTGRRRQIRDYASAR